MKPTHVLYLAVSCVVATFFLMAGWEFVIEDRVPSLGNIFHGNESQAERWEFVMTATIGVALVAGVLAFFGYRAAAERESFVQALYASEQRFKDYAEAASEWYWEMGADLRFTSVSAKYEMNTGIPVRNAIGKRRDEVTLGETSDERWRRHLADLEGRRPFRNFEYAQKTPDGSLVHFSISGRPVFDRRGTFSGYRGTGRNITKRKQAEQALQQAHDQLEARVLQRTADLMKANEALRTEITVRRRAEDRLREREERLEQAIQLSGLGYYLWDATEDRCLYCSEECASIHGTTVADYVAGGPGLDGELPFIHPEDREKARAAFRILRAGSDIDLEYRVATPAGAVRFIRQVARPVFDDSGTTIFERGTIQDITQRKVAEAAVRERDDRLSTLQSQLLQVSRVSAMGQMSMALAHELKQPLTAIVNYCRATSRMFESAGTVLPGRTGEMIDKTVEQALRAGEIIRGLGRVFEARDMAFAAEDLNAVIEEACQLAMIEARHHGITVTMDLGERIPPVGIDRIQIQQVAHNLMRNGIEAMIDSDRRELTIRTFYSGNGLSEVAVCDTGPGIPEHVETHLFEPLVTSKPNGMGVGLSISHSIIKSHSGELRAEPNPEGGTIFSFTLPIVSNSHSSRSKDQRRVA